MKNSKGKATKSAKPKDRLPSWLEAALRGIPFWVGHRRATYWRHDLVEGAIVGELCNLIQANLCGKLRLTCEEPCSAIAGSQNAADSKWGAERVDLVVTGEKGAADYLTAIEVKRAKSSRKLIHQDLRKLATLKRSRPGLSTYLVLVSEGKRPALFVGKEGRAKQEAFAGVQVRTRRVFAASPSVTRRASAHYAVAVEVLGVSDT